MVGINQVGLKILSEVAHVIGSRILLSYGRADWLKSGSVGAFYNTRRPSGPRATEGMIDCHLMLEAL